MQCACAILLSVANAALNVFPHYLVEGTIFEKIVFEHKMCFDFFYNVCPKYFSF